MSHDDIGQALFRVCEAYIDYHYSDDSEFRIGELISTAEHCYKIFRSEKSVGTDGWDDREAIHAASELLIAKYIPPRKREPDEDE